MRLEQLTGKIKKGGGLKLIFGVYRVIGATAVAGGDGSVHIRAGRMHIRTDFFFKQKTAYEIGHVIHTDSKDAMKNAYLRSAV